MFFSFLLLQDSLQGLHSVAGPFDVTTAVGRVGVVRTVINMYRLLLLMRPLLPQLRGQIPPYTLVQRGFTSVFFDALKRHYVKDITEFGAEDTVFSGSSLEAMEAAYAAAATCPHLVHCESAPALSRGNTYHVVLRETGTALDPEPKDWNDGGGSVLRGVVRAACAGAAALHAAGIVHRDIRRQNVVWSSAQGHHVLIDLELAEFEGAPPAMPRECRPRCWGSSEAEVAATLDESSHFTSGPNCFGMSRQ